MRLIQIFIETVLAVLIGILVWMNLKDKVDPQTLKSWIDRLPFWKKPGAA